MCVIAGSRTIRGAGTVHRARNSSSSVGTTQPASDRFDLLKWGLIPYWCEDPKGGRKPINAKSETVTRLPFREAYRKRRCVLPVDGFYEWKATKHGKQPYAIAMKDRSPFGIAALWENWRDPSSREWVRIFVLLTTRATQLIAPIHDRMPAILNPAATNNGSDLSLTRTNCWLHSQATC